MRLVFGALFGALALTANMNAMAEPAGAGSASSQLKLAISVSADSNVFSKVRAAFEKESGISIKYSGDVNTLSADLILRQVDQGEAEAGAASLPWEDWVRLMKEKKYEIKNLGQMHRRVIGKDLIRIVTYPAGPKRLTLEQIKSLLAGKVKNWKELGGEDRPTRLVTAVNQPGLKSYLEKRVLDGASIPTADAIIPGGKSSSPDVVMKVAETPGAYGAVGAEVANSSVNVPEQPSIGRPITMLFLGKPRPELQRLFDFIRDKGPGLGVYAGE